MGRRGWRRWLPFPRRATLRRWFPDFDTRNLVHLIGRAGADLVVDAGANAGQYGVRLRAGGWRGPILSVEPLAGAHARLTARASGDAGWRVAPRMALGAAAGQGVLKRLADDTLSSLHRPAPRAAGSPALAVEAQECVPVTTLDMLMAAEAPESRRPFVKLDLQGHEMAAIEGGGETLARAAGMQVELAMLESYAGAAGWLDLLGALDRHGFVPVYCMRVVARRRPGPWLEWDAVLLRRDAL